MRNTTQRPHTIADTEAAANSPEIRSELSRLHAKLDLVRELKQRELHRIAVESLNGYRTSGFNRKQPANRLAMAIASLLVMAAAVAGAVSLAVFLFISN